MNDDRGLETRVSAWLDEEAQGSLPDWALRETFSRTRSLRQERGLRSAISARSSRSMRHPGPSTRGRSQMSLLSAAAVVLVGVVGAGLYLTNAPDTATLPSSGATAEPGEWIVFEHFGQAPDGSTTEMDFDRRQIWLTRPDGSGLHELAPGQPVDGKSSPDVSPDGTHVVFSSWSPRSLLYEVSIEGGEPQLLSTACSGFQGECQEWDPTYSPDRARASRSSAGKIPQGAVGSLTASLPAASGSATWPAAR